jgi:ubiquinone/menaquinone biosynthesis C-methylase UbiE
MKNEKDSLGEQDFKSGSYAHKLFVSNPLREQLLKEVIRELRLPPGSSGLDAGCGIGLQTILLAETVGPAGNVTGLDISSEFLAYGKRLAANAGLAKQVSFMQGDVDRLPFDNDSFDWIWSADCAGYPATKPVELLKEFSRLVKPGGAVAILIYSSQMLLPGYPLLEARLNATPTGIAPFSENMRPDQHFLRALGWFQKADLTGIRAKTFVGSFHAPLDDRIRAALACLIDMRWGGAFKEVPGEVWAEYERLCRPDSPHFILNLPDYYAFFSYSLFYGKIAE